MKNLLILNISLILTITIFSCGDDDPTTEEPKFDYHAHIESPDNSNKHVGHTLDIKVMFESHTGETIHHINVRIYNESSGTEIYNKPSDAHIHEEDGEFIFEDQLGLTEANGVEGHTDWILEAKIWGNGEGVEEEVSQVKFHVHPG